MQKNVASQRWIVFAFDETDNTVKTGDAANITGNLRIDLGAADAIDDTNPTELEGGYYYFDLTQAETNGDHLLICPVSSTGDIQVIGVPGAVWTTSVSHTRAGYLDELAAANLPADLDTVLGRLSAGRAGYLDNLSAGAVALASVCTEARLAELAAANLPTDIDLLLTRLSANRASYLDELAAANIPADIDLLIARFTAARAGYLDNLSAGAVALASACTEARLAQLNEANIPGDIDDIVGYVDQLENRLTAARAGYLDELAAANLPADIDLLLTRITAAVATAAALSTHDGKLDTVDTIVDTLLTRITAAVALASALATHDTDIKALAPHGTAMRGTDSAYTGTPPTVAQIRTEIDAASTQLAAIKAKTDLIVTGFKKNAALPKWSFVMVDSAGAPTTGLTVTGQIAKDEGNFGAIENAITEKANGIYDIASGFTQAEMNADCITLRFTATGAKARIITIFTTS